MPLRTSPSGSSSTGSFGVERFFLYDNGSTDDHRDVLAPYLDEGIVIVHDWPMPFIGRRGRAGALQRAFDHCLGAHREDSRWIAFLDLDEFLFSPTGASLSELLPEYEEYSGGLREPRRVRDIRASDAA